MVLKCIEKTYAKSYNKNKAYYIFWDGNSTLYMYDEHMCKRLIMEQGNKNLGCIKLCKDGKIRVYRDKGSNQDINFKSLLLCSNQRIRCFSRVDKVPYGYGIWNISMPNGYLPLCELSQTQLEGVVGGRSINVNTLKVLRTEHASDLCELSTLGYGTVSRMELLLMDKSKAGNYEYKLAKKLLPIAKELGLVYNI